MLHIRAQKRWIEGATTEANELPFLSSIEKGPLSGPDTVIVTRS